MADSTEVNGRAKVCDQREHRATIRPRDRRRSDVSTHCEEFVGLSKRNIFWTIVIQTKHELKE